MLIRMGTVPREMQREREGRTDDAMIRIRDTGINGIHNFTTETVIFDAATPAATVFHSQTERDLMHFA